jgi:hypothetical protein
VRNEFVTQINVRSRAHLCCSGANAHEQENDVQLGAGINCDSARQIERYLIFCNGTASRHGLQLHLSLADRLEQ